MLDKKEENNGPINIPKLNTIKKLQIIIGSIIGIMTIGIIIPYIDQDMFFISALLFLASYGMIIILFIKLLKVKKL